MNSKADDLHYSMIIRWDPRDDIFVVAVPELPGCYTHGRTYEEAIAQGKDAIETWIDGAIEDREDLPAPRYFVDDDIEMVSRVAATA